MFLLFNFLIYIFLKYNLIVVAIHTNGTVSKSEYLQFHDTNDIKLFTRNRLHLFFAKLYKMPTVGYNLNH